MKKIILILLVICLFGCQKQDKELSVVCPSGAPSIAFYNEIDNESFHTADAASILPELKGDNGSDIIVIDTVNGIKALNAGANYSLAATITFGNFYIASTGNDENGIMDNGDYIVVFSQGATPDLIFHYIYGNVYDSNLHYVQAVSDAATCLIKGINIADEANGMDNQYVDYVMIAEPALTAALSQNNKASIYTNIQDEYKKKSNDLQMIQASIFVSKKLSLSNAKEYLNNLQETINSLLDNPDLFVEGTSNLSDTEFKDIFGIPNNKIAKKVLDNNSIGLGFVDAYNNKESIDAFISIFGLEETNEEIYFK